jgi:DNA (cytosine-5)-methyltransferase 1
VFVVASARTDFDPSKVLFEREGVRRDSAPSREAGENSAFTTGASFKVGSHWDGNGYAHPTLTQSHNTGGIGASNQELFSQRGSGLVMAFSQNNTSGPVHVSHALNAHAGPHGRLDFESETFLVQAVHGTQDPDTNIELAHTLGRNQGQENAVAYSVSLRGREGGATAELGGEVAGCLRASSGGGDKPHVLAQCATGDITHTLKAEGFDASADGTGRGQPIAPVSYGIRTANTSSNGWGIQEEVTHTLDTAQGIAVSHHMAVRRLTPVECERLQGFPDGHTDVPYRGKPASDGPRYKAIGNSMAVPCMKWIGERIKLHLEAV